MTRTDTERLDWLLNKTISVEHCGPDAEFTIQFRAIIPKDRGGANRHLTDFVRHSVDAMMDFGHIPHAPDPRRERLARAMTTNFIPTWEDMNENTRKLHLAEADRLLAAIDGREQG